MHICNNCKEKMAAAEQGENPRPFPAFTVSAGIAGTIAGAATGLLLLVPAAIILGAAADCRRCGQCGAEMDESDDGYHLMEEMADESGCHSYRSSANPPRSRHRQQSFGSGMTQRAPEASEPSVVPQESSLPVEPEAEDAQQDRSDMTARAPEALDPSAFLQESSLSAEPEDEDAQQDRDIYVYDGIEGALVRQAPEIPEPGFDFDVPASSQFASGAEAVSAEPEMFNDVPPDGFVDVEGIGQGFEEPFDFEGEPPMEESGL